MTKLQNTLLCFTLLMKVSLDSSNSAPERISPKPVGRLVFGGALLAALLSTQATAREVFAQTALDPKPTETEVSPEVKKIRALEAGFRDFGARVLPQLDHYVRSEASRAKIRRAFKRVEENAKNPNRFKSGSMVSFGQERGFSYHFRSYQSVPAEFRGLTRTISLPDDFDPADLGDLSYLLHELVHVEHDDELRRSVPWDRYIAFWATTTPLCVVEHELDGISVEMEALNAVLHGDFQRNGVVAARRSGVRENLSANAKEYFRDSSLRDFVERSCRMRGAQIFTPQLLPIP